MNNTFLRLAFTCVLAAAFHGWAFGQDDASRKRKALRLTGKISLVMAKATAKATYETVKFTGKHIVVPTFKNVVVPAAKATPPIASKAVKLAAKGIKNGLKAVTDPEAEDDDDATEEKTSN